VALRVAATFKFVVELGEDELEEFLEHVHAGVGEDFVFHLKDQVLERLALVDEFVVLDQVGYGPAFREDVRELFQAARNARDVLEVVRVLAVVVRNLLPIGPHAHGSAGGVAVALELLLAVLELGLFQLDQDVGRGGPVFVEDADVGAFFSRPKVTSYSTAIRLTG